MISNLVEVSWFTQDVSHPSPAYVAAVVLTGRKTVPQLLARLTRPSSIRPSMETQRTIMQLLSNQHASQEIDTDVQIASSSLRLPLECPAMRSRMRLPARAGTCEHVQCFDLEGYIRMNEKRPSKTRTFVHHSRSATFSLSQLGYVLFATNQQPTPIYSSISSFSISSASVHRRSKQWNTISTGNGRLSVKRNRHDEEIAR